MTYYHPNPPPPKPGMSLAAKLALGCGIPTALFIVFAGGCMALVGGAANEVDKQVQKDKAADARAAKEDVKLVSCKIVDDSFGPDVEAKIKVTNNGDKRANYWIAVEFLDAKGNQVDSLDAYVENLAPGASTTRDFTGIFVAGQLEGVTKGTCKILDVSRDELFAAN